MATKWSEIKHKGEDTPERRARMEQLREEVEHEQDEFERTGVDPYEQEALAERVDAALADAKRLIDRPR